jgi:cytochrome c biogenesis protein CcdA
MFALIAVAVTVGLGDSVNPSTVGPALYLATGNNAVRRVLGFTLGVFGAYLAGGVVLTLGPGQAILRLLPRPSPRTTHLVELVAGISLGLVALGLWLGRQRVARRLAQTKTKIRWSATASGAAIMLLELPTAFPYFGVIAAIVGSGRSISTQLVLLVIFNVAFVAPLLLIAATRGLLSEKGTQVLERVRAALDRKAAALIPIFILAIALVIGGVGAVGLAR